MSSAFFGPASRHSPAACVILVLAMACGSGPNPVVPVPTDSLQLTLLTDALVAPVYLTAPPGDTARLFVVEQGGRIRVLRNSALLALPFLDLTGRVTSGGEQGLLSLAFDPDYPQTRRFYVYYTDLNGDTRVVRYRAGLNPDLADPATAEEILAVEQPFTNHNGGLVLFGPDGYLYVGLGDGGSAGDPLGHGQDLGTLLGAILRLDVSGPGTYRIPPDNPFVGRPGARGEIWAYGLRNPWRFSFDRETDDLYIGDVGQDRLEEIDVQPASSGGGENYGWNVMEGSECYNTSICNRTGLVLPVAQYTHLDGCSVTGGYVYRGADLPSLRGRYFYSDYCAGWVRSFLYRNGTATDHQDWAGILTPGAGVTSFGEDARGELYITTHTGRLYRLAARE